jgi:hypothetical protein
MFNDVEENKIQEYHDGGRWITIRFADLSRQIGKSNHNLSLAIQKAHPYMKIWRLGWTVTSDYLIGESRTGLVADNFILPLSASIGGQFTDFQ